MVAQHRLKPSINANQMRQKLSQPTVKLFTEASLFFSREFNAFNIRIKDRTEIESIEHTKKTKKINSEIIQHQLLTPIQTNIGYRDRSTNDFFSYSPSGQN